MHLKKLPKAIKELPESIPRDNNYIRCKQSVNTIKSQKFSDQFKTKQDPTPCCSLEPQFKQKTKIG